MFVHLGENFIVRQEDVVGIFDIDTSTMKKSTEKLLYDAQEKKKLRTISKEIPRSIVITKNKKDSMVYLSSVSTRTLKQRWNNCL